MVTTQSVMDFLREHVASCRNWSDEALLVFVDWHREKKFIATIQDEEGKLLAVGMAVPTDDAERTRRQYDYWNEAGNILFVSMVASTHPTALRQLWCVALRKFGMLEQVATVKLRHSGRLTIFNLKHFTRKLLGDALWTL